MNNYSKIDEIMKKQKEQQEKQQKEIENMKIACKEIFKSNEAKFFLKFLKKISFWSEQDCNISNDVLIYKKGRRDMWLIIRNLIPKDVLAQIEIYDEEGVTI